MRVLIIGLGSIARKHIHAITKLVPDVELTALRSSADAPAVDGVKNIYSWEGIGSTPKFDFAIISNPTSQHLSSIEKLLEYNMPLFIEKPLHNKVVDEKLTDLIKTKNIITYIACNLRFLHSLQEIKKIISQQRINEVNVYCGSFLPEWRPYTDYKTTYSAIPELGGGVHIDLIHEIDYIYWLFGAPVTSKSFFSNKSSLGIRACDYANYLLEYPDFNSSIVLNYYRRDYKRTLEILTDNHTYLVDLAKNNISQDGSVIFSSDQKIIDTYECQMEYFLHCIKQNKASFNTIQTANEILKICLNNDTKR